MHDGVNWYNITNITRNIWTNGVECGKICIESSQRLRAWRSEVLALCKGGDVYGNTRDANVYVYVWFIDSSHHVLEAGQVIANFVVT